VNICCLLLGVLFALNAVAAPNDEMAQAMKLQEWYSTRGRLLANDIQVALTKAMTSEEKQHTGGVRIIFTTTPSLVAFADNDNLGRRITLSS
jgi:hypothetical protein